MELLGYARWENFQTAVKRAIESCETTGYEPDNHFRGVTKMVRLGSGAERSTEDFMLTRYACYLIAQNGAPRKEAIAFAQSYFAHPNPQEEINRRINPEHVRFDVINSYSRLMEIVGMRQAAGA